MLTVRFGPEWSLFILTITEKQVTVLLIKMKTPSVIKSLKLIFGPRIVTLVGYGSYFFNRSHDDSDIDLCLVLDKRTPDDLINLKKILASSSSINDITVHYLEELEQRGWGNFTHGTHGAFFLYHLSHAQLLLGYDLFASKAHLVSQQSYRQSLIDQIVAYGDRLQQRIVLGTKKDDRRFYAKYFSRIMVDMMLLDASISFREINRCSPTQLLDEFFSKSSLFSTKTCRLLRIILSTEEDPSEVAEQLLIDIIKTFVLQQSAINKELLHV